MTSRHMELAIANLIGYRQNVIVPNVSWGLGLGHECDMLVMDSKSRFTEVEIKISKADLRADMKKKHGHASELISRLIYAVPDPMLEFSMGVIPKGCGIIAVGWDTYRGRYYARWVTMVQHRKTIPVPPQKVRKFLELGCMRIWTLKQHLITAQQKP